MRLVQLQRPLRVVAAGSVKTTAALSSFWWTHRPDLLCAAPSNHLGNANKVVEGRRAATVKSQGAYKLTNKKTLPKKLGAKRSGDQYVIPGNIIYKQRGTIWHPGENTIMGRDHTIHAAVAGYVKYYRDSKLNPKRQYIGVAFNRDDTLPYPAHGVRRRQLSMVAVPRAEPAPPPEGLSPSGIPIRVIRKEGPAPASPEEAEAEKNKFRNNPAARVQRAIEIRRSNRVLLLQDDYSYRESNIAIGKLMGRHKGKTPGTVRVGSRHGMLKARRRERAKRFAQLKEMAAQKKEEERKAEEARKAKEAKKAKKTAAATATPKDGEAKKVG